MVVIMAQSTLHSPTILAWISTFTITNTTFVLLVVQETVTTRRIVKKDWSVRFVASMNQSLIVQALASREKIIAFRTSQCRLQRRSRQQYRRQYSLQLVRHQALYGRFPPFPRFYMWANVRQRTHVACVKVRVLSVAAIQRSSTCLL
jgi:hypothetical protein